MQNIDKCVYDIKYRRAQNFGMVSQERLSSYPLPSATQDTPSSVNFLDAVRPDLKEIITTRTPLVAVSMEMIPGLIAGGLGALGIDQDNEKKARNIPSISVTLLLDNWRQEIDENFWQQVRVYTPDFKALGYQRVTSVTIAGEDGKEEDLDVYILSTGNHTSLGLRGDLGYLYEGPTISESRLRQQIALGFGGFKAIKRLQVMGELEFEDAASIDLNEVATFAFGLAYLSNLIEQRSGFEEALRHTQEKSVYANHTLVQAAVIAYPLEWMEKYVFRNVAQPVESWIRHMYELNGRTGYLNLSHLMLELAGIYTGVSKRHAEIASKRFTRLNHKPVRFEANSNGIFMGKWFHPQAHALYRDSRVIDVNDLPTAGYQNRIESLDATRLREDQEKETAELIQYLALERIDQYGRPIIIPDDATLLAWPRRWEAYKRPEMAFKNPDRLADILEKYNMHYLLAGKAHPNSGLMIQSLHDVLVTVDQNPRLKQRVHFIVNHDEEFEKYAVRGAYIWVNTPEDGYDNPDEDQEACGTSIFKSDKIILISTRSGGMADVEEEPYLRIQGSSYEEQVESLYQRLEQAGEIATDPKQSDQLVKGRLKVFLPTMSSARMLKDKLDTALPEKIDVVV